MSYDLTNKTISSTFQNLLQKTGSDNRLYDLEGNEITNLRINGNLIADQYIVSSSVTNVQFQQQSGSTIFGDSQDDTHQLTGSMYVSGSMEVVDGNISASGNIYAQTGSFTQLTIPQDSSAANPTLNFGDGNTGIYESGDNTLNFAMAGSNKWIMSATALTSGNVRGNKLMRVTGTATAPVYAINNDTNTGIGSSAADNLSLITGGVETLRLALNTISGSSTSTGSFGSGYIDNKLGIGTTSPSEMLELAGSDVEIKLQQPDGQVAMRLRGNSNGGIINLTNSAGSTATYLHGGDDSYFTGGNVGIGTTNPSYDLQVGTGSTTPGGSIAIDKGSNTYSSLHFLNGGSVKGEFRFNAHESLIWKNAGSDLFTILEGGDVGIGTGSPTKALTVEGDISASGAISTESHITASGNISGSATSTGSFGSVHTVGVHTAGKVGIGTTSPNYPLAVEDGDPQIYFNATDYGPTRYMLFRPSTGEINTYNSRMSLNGSATTDIAMVVGGGNVGIGIESPTSRIHGYVAGGWSSGVPAFTFHNNDGGTGEGNVMLVRGGGNEPTSNIFEVQDWSGNTEFQIDGLGDVTIAGDITASGDISASGAVYGSTFYDQGVEFGADYVFEPEYTLRTLTEVEEHIEEHQHLPGVPSVDDVSGWKQLSIGDRDMKLLEKVEELTLYVIDLQKQIDELKKVKS